MLFDYFGHGWRIAFIYVLCLIWFGFFGFVFLFGFGLFVLCCAGSDIMFERCLYVDFDVVCCYDLICFYFGLGLVNLFY